MAITNLSAKVDHPLPSVDLHRLISPRTRNFNAGDYSAKRRTPAQQLGIVTWTIAHARINAVYATKFQILSALQTPKKLKNNDSLIRYVQRQKEPANNTSGSVYDNDESKRTHNLRICVITEQFERGSFHRPSSFAPLEDNPPPGNHAQSRSGTGRLVSR